MNEARDFETHPSPFLRSLQLTIASTSTLPIFQTISLYFSQI
ncbi:hypothetical protein NIES2104_10460 [Leptolyngbya sp. NIES-2104]|nr:hypothetical protein NIES2104_10460 [Leptolyngbya sp. NIES-2104]